MTYRRLYGIAAEFDDPEPLVDAARLLHEKGFRHFEAYTPYPVRQLDKYIEARARLPLMVFVGGISGTAVAFLMQYYIAVIDYPTNIGGRPLMSWPSFIVIMFELTILFAAVTAFLGALGLAGFPRPHHPVFNTRDFENTSNNRFFLCVEARDPLFDAERVTDLLSQTDPLEVQEIEED